MATSIRLAPETEQRLDYLASQTGRTKAYYLREIIDQGIEDVEDYYLAPTCGSACARGKSQCIPPLTFEQTLAWTIDYADTARQQLRKLDRHQARCIVDFMDERIAARRLTNFSTKIYLEIYVPLVRERKEPSPCHKSRFISTMPRRPWWSRPRRQTACQKAGGLQTSFANTPPMNGPRTVWRWRAFLPTFPCGKATPPRHMPMCRALVFSGLPC